MTIDWDLIEKEYLTIRGLLEPVGLPSAEVLLEHRALAAANRALASTLSSQLQYGARVAPGSKTLEEQRRTFANDVRDAEVSGIINVPSLFDKIETAIKRKSLTTDFIISWGHLGALLGRLHELENQDDAAEEEFRKSVDYGSSQDAIAQRYWYAAWVLARVKQGVGRDDAEFDLAELCCEVWTGRRPPPKTFEPHWFEKLIWQEKLVGEGLESVPKTGARTPVHLRSSFTRIGWKRLEAMSTSRVIPADLIPPLDATQFPAG